MNVWAPWQTSQGAHTFAGRDGQGSIRPAMRVHTDLAVERMSKIRYNRAPYTPRVVSEAGIVNRLLRMVPGAAAARLQIDIWRAQMRELRPLYPVVLPFLAWVYTRAYRREQERLRLDRLDPILRSDKRLREKRQDRG